MNDDTVQNYTMEISRVEDQQMHTQGSKQTKSFMEDTYSSAALLKQNVL